MMGWHDGWGMGGWSTGGWLMMVLVLVVFWSSLAALVLVWLRGTDRSRSDREHPNHTGWDRGTRDQGTAPDAGDGSARRLLDERFARGEIDEQDYTRRRDLLSR